MSIKIKHLLDRGPRAVIDAFWSKMLNFLIRELSKREIRIVGVDRRINVPPRWPLMAMKAYGGCVIPIEREKVNEARNIFEGFHAEEVFTDKGIERIRTLFGVSRDRIAHWLHLYCDEEDFKPHEKKNARRLMPYGRDKEICEEWRSKYPRAIGPYSYQYANPISYGIVVNGELASISMVWRYNLPFWEIGVETAPDYRGRGYAKSVASVATKRVFAGGKIPWYYLDIKPTNVASLKVAKSLGYFEHSETLNYKQQS